MNELFIGTLPEGVGNVYLAESLKLLKDLPTKKLILELVVEEETLRSWKFGDSAERSLLGKCAKKALNSLGIEGVEFAWEVVRGQVNIAITTRK